MNYLNLSISFFIGAIGTASYPLLVKLGFTGGKTFKERYKLLEPFLDKPFLAIPAYCFFGGFISAVIQWLTVGTLVPLQSLITGITWPIFVSGFLSGRQSELNPEEKPLSEKLMKELKPQLKESSEEDRQQLLKILSAKNINSKDLTKQKKNEKKES